ncbi:hypothetical protein LINPERHAP1_LOCUS4219 [Linum perenne]
MQPNKRAPRQHYQRRNSKQPVAITHDNRRHVAKNGDVPSWEKRFCLVVGRMLWKDFLSSKDYVDSFPNSFHNVVNWDDSAGRDSFRFAKARFYAEHYSAAAAFGGGDGGVLPPLPCPETHIDEVVWRESTDEERRLAAEIEEAQETARRLVEAAAAAEVEEEEKLRNRLWNSTPLEEIKAMGWDDDVGLDSWQNPTLTGMIVGGGDDDDCGREFIQGGMNYKENGAENRNGEKLTAAAENRSGEKLTAAAENGVDAERRRVNWRRIPNNVASH